MAQEPIAVVRTLGEARAMELELAVNCENIRDRPCIKIANENQLYWPSIFIGGVYFYPRFEKL